MRGWTQARVGGDEVREVVGARSGRAFECVCKYKEKPLEDLAEMWHDFTQPLEVITLGTKTEIRVRRLL